MYLQGPMWDKKINEAMSIADSVTAVATDIGDDLINNMNNRRPHGTRHVHGHCHNSITAFNDMSHELRVDVGLDSDIAKGGLVSLEELYDHMRGILKTTESSTFTEHIEKLMLKQGFRA